MVSHATNPALLLAACCALTACDARNTPTPAPAAPFNLEQVQNSPQYAKGKELFQGLCIRCHAEQGQGQPGLVPTLHDAPFTTGSPGAFARILLHGMDGKVTVKGHTYEAVMPPATFNSDEELSAVMTFVRNSWGNAAGPVTPEDVAAVKRETQGRVKPWREHELKDIK